MRQRLGNPFSWVALVALLLLLFSLWNFLIRSDLPEPGSAGINPACRSERISEISGQGFVVRYRSRGCSAVARSSALRALGQAERSPSLLRRLSLPPLRSDVVVDLRPGDRPPRTYPVLGRPGAAVVFTGRGDESLRFDLDSALVDLALAEAEPSLPRGQRKILAGALVFALPRYRGAELRILVPDRVQELGQRTGGNYYRRLCRNGSCQTENL